MYQNSISPLRNLICPGHSIAGDLRPGAQADLPRFAINAFETMGKLFELTPVRLTLDDVVAVYSNFDLPAGEAGIPKELI